MIKRFTRIEKIAYHAFEECPPQFRILFKSPFPDWFNEIQEDALMPFEL
jgi:hypothetical protein